MDKNISKEKNEKIQDIKMEMVKMATIEEHLE